jgi:hypothetical protein
MCTVYSMAADYLFGIPEYLLSDPEIIKYLRMRLIGYSDAEARKTLSWKEDAYPALEFLNTGKEIETAYKERQAYLARNPGGPLKTLDEAIDKAKANMDKLAEQEREARKEEDLAQEAAKDFLLDIVDSPEMGALEVRFPLTGKSGEYQILTVSQFVAKMAEKRDAMKAAGVDEDDIEASIYESYLLLAKCNKDMFALPSPSSS